MLEKSYEHDIGICSLLLIDFKQRFDAVSSSKLFKDLTFTDIPKKLVRMVQITLDKTKSRTQK